MIRNQKANERRAWRPVHMGEEVPEPIGAYSRAVRAGNTIYVSGQVPTDLRTGKVVGKDVVAQTRQTLENVKQVLAAAGATLADVVSVNAYLASIDDWAAFNEIYRDTFKPPYPARTTIGAQLHGVLVEISVVAVVRA
ncbi:MAG TPA: Rid family detoxifying hydrolase [Gemmatimonadaceae bacterium]|nr:Rid family detoxifying hydrolase [Gemmatimonadaceae bacterium]